MTTLSTTRTALNQTTAPSLVGPRCWYSYAATAVPARPIGNAAAPSPTTAAAASPNHEHARSLRHAVEGSAVDVCEGFGAGLLVHGGVGFAGVMVASSKCMPRWHVEKRAAVVNRILPDAVGGSLQGLGRSTNDLISVLCWQRSIALRPLSSLLLGWNRDIKGQDRRGDRGCCASDPASATVMVLEGWDASTVSESSRPARQR